jgi:hypothetical protein
MVLALEHQTSRREINWYSSGFKSYEGCSQGYEIAVLLMESVQVHIIKTIKIKD